MQEPSSLTSGITLDAPVGTEVDGGYQVAHVDLRTAGCDKGTRPRVLWVYACDDEDGFVMANSPTYPLVGIQIQSFVTDENWQFDVTFASALPLIGEPVPGFRGRLVVMCADGPLISEPFSIPGA